MVAETALTTERATTTALSQQFGGELTVELLVARKEKIRIVLDKVMREGEHYGIIPGTGNKPSLFKAGAEVLATTFGLAPAFTVRRTDLASGHREYEITCQLRHITTGVLLGEGLGSCSTMESKYRWRRGERKCPTCNAGAIMRSKYPDRETNVAGWYCNTNRGGCGAQFPHNAPAIADQPTGRTENPDIADVYNTVLKMAKKRAQVDATLTAVGASDLLTQDLEDLEHDDAPAAAAASSSTTRTTESKARPAQQEPTRTSKPPANAKPANPPAPEELRDDPRAEKLALEIIAGLEESTTPEEVATYAPEVNRLPKGTRARHSAFDAYQRNLTRVTKAATQH